MHGGQQNRIPVEPKFDGRGVPGEADNQLGRNPVGKTTVRVVDHTVLSGVFRPRRVTTSHIHRLQGNVFRMFSSVQTHPAQRTLVATAETPSYNIVVFG